MASLIEKDTSGIYIAQDGELEIEGHRTRSFKKFGNGRQRRVAGQIGPIHYRTDPFSTTEDYKEIDLTINLTPGEDWDAAMEANGYQVRFWQNRNGSKYVAQFRRAGKWLAMAPLALMWENGAGQKELIGKPAGGITPVIDNDASTVTWDNCFGPGLHYRYNVRPDEFFKTVIIDDKTDLPAPTISGPGLKLAVVLGVAWHSLSKAANGFADSVVPDEMPNDSSVVGVDEELVDPDVFAYQDESFRDTFWLRKPKAWDSAAERHTIAVDWRLRRRGDRVFAALSVPASALNNPAVEYPIFIDVDIAEEDITAGNDDTYYAPEDTVLYTRTATISQVGNQSFDTWYRQATAVRFQSIPIADGVVIDSATITFRANASESDEVCIVRIQGEDVDDPAEWPSASGAFETRYAVRTSAYTEWTVPVLIGGVWYESPSFPAVVQELIDRGGWSSGQDMAFFVHDDESDSDEFARRTWSTYENTPVGTKSAKFNASYNVGGGQIMHIRRR